MVHRWIASANTGSARRHSLPGLTSLAAHAAIVALAASVTTGTADPPRPPAVSDDWFVVPEPRHTAGPNEATPAGGLVVVSPDGGFSVPDVGLPDLTAALGALGIADWHASAAPRAGGALAGGRSAAGLVEDGPALLGGPALEYPDLLRRAGVEGRVLVEAVIDTAGRAEPGSVTVVSSPHSGFDGPARTYVAAARFRPGRAGGRPVRVLVRIPIDFTLRRR